MSSIKAMISKDYFYEHYKVGVKEEDDYSGGVEFSIPLHILLSVIDQIQEKGKVDWRSPVKVGMFEMEIEEHQGFEREKVKIKTIINFDT